MENLRHRQWSELPPELVTDIAQRLDLIEVTRLCSVCRSWNNAGSSPMSARIELLKHELWFLHYGYDSSGHHECKLITAEHGNITMRLQELDDTTTCIGSNHGWLLMFKQGGSMFFYRPFSKTTINLPNFPHSELDNHVAAFSSPPTCDDCTVCVFNRSASNADELELNLLRQGHHEWIQHKHSLARSLLDPILSACFNKAGIFVLMDNNDNLVRLSVNPTGEVSWQHDKVITVYENSPGTYHRRGNLFRVSNLMKKLGLEDVQENVTFNVCGTQTRTEQHDLDKFIYNEVYEEIKKHDEESMKQKRRFKGVWIRPTLNVSSKNVESW